jgi:GNAT superfamily N-acetyltransferase
MARRPARYRPRLLRMRDAREVTLCAIDAADWPEIAQAFERLSSESRYARFLQHKRQLDSAALSRGVNPRPGQDFAFVATVPATDGIDIVGAAQYVRVGDADATGCEFAITVAENWRGSGLAAQLLASLIRRARRDGCRRMEGMVMATNSTMLGLARRLGFTINVVSDDATVLCVERIL